VPTDDRYVRVYMRITEDLKFSEIYGDDHHLATWLRLLLVADSAWPAAAPLPVGVRPSSVAALAKVGLIDLQEHRHYRVHGLDAERTKRSQSGRIAAVVRWQRCGRNANPMLERERDNRTSQKVLSNNREERRTVRADTSVVPVAKIVDTLKTEAERRAKPK
jgi:hypothetical protein